MINGRLPDYPEPPLMPKRDRIKRIIADLENDLVIAIYCNATKGDVEDILSQIEAANEEIGQQYKKPEIISTGKPVCPYCQTVMFIEQVDGVPYWMCECSDRDLAEKINHGKDDDRR